jgi:hypothetical protein
MPLLLASEGLGLDCPRLPSPGRHRNVTTCVCRTLYYPCARDSASSRASLDEAESRTTGYHRSVSTSACVSRALIGKKAVAQPETVRADPA